MSCHCTPQWRFLSSQARWSYCASGFWRDLASHQLELPVSDPKHENTIIFKANMLSRKANFYWNHKIQCWNTAYNHSAQSLTIFMATTTCSYNIPEHQQQKKETRRNSNIVLFILITGLWRSALWETDIKIIPNKQTQPECSLYVCPNVLWSPRQNKQP